MIIMDECKIYETVVSACEKYTHCEQNPQIKKKKQTTAQRSGRVSTGQCARQIERENECERERTA